MIGPTDDYREAIYRRLATLPNVEDGVRIVSTEVEERLDGILADIREQAANDVETSDYQRGLAGGELASEEAEQILTAVDQWASIASYAVAWVYAPQSPSPKKLAGWAACIANYLRKLADVLTTPLRAASKALASPLHGFPAAGVRQDAKVAFP